MPGPDYGLGHVVAEPRERFWDALAAVSNVIFAVALLPTVVAGTILPIASSIATIVALCMLSAILIHFKLWWGLGFNLVCTGMWVTLLGMAL